MLFAWRMPGTLEDFGERASANAAKTPVDRLLVVADSLDVDNQFVRESLARLPEDARYAVLLAQSPEIALTNYGMSAITYGHLPGFMLYLLLPRRQVAPEEAEYVLCVGCDTDPWNPKTTWLWRNDQGVGIGQVTG